MRVENDLQTVGNMFLIHGWNKPYSINSYSISYDLILLSPYPYKGNRKKVVFIWTCHKIQLIGLKILYSKVCSLLF